MQKLLRRAEAADYLRAHGVRCAASTLAKLAVSGAGPSFVRVGVYPAYAIEELDRWIGTKISKPMKRADEIPAKGLGLGPQTKPAQRRPGQPRKAAAQADFKPDAPA
jgi:hypothetical protein